MSSGVGRNDSCPCGSGLKYKKCCLLTEGAMNAAHPKKANVKRTKQNDSPAKQQKTTQPVLVTFASLKGNSTEELAWIGPKSRNHRKVLENIQAYLIEEPAFDVSSTLNEAGGIALIFDFRCPKDWGNYGIDIPFRITIEEEKEGGSLGFSLSFSHSKLNSSDIEVELNASLFLTWIAVSAGSRHAEVSELILFQADAVREKLAKAWDERAAKKKESEELAKLLEPIKLERVTIVSMPRYPDGAIIGPEHHLYSQLTSRPAAGANAQSAVSAYIKPLLNTAERKSIGDSLPAVFLEPPDQMRNSYMASQKLVQLANTIKYHFSDSSIVGAQSILRHPFVSLVPPDLLPGGAVSSRSLHLWRKNFSDPNRQVKPNKDQLKILNEVRLATTQDASSRYSAAFEHYEYPDAQRTNLALNDILFALGERLRLGEISVHLAFFEDFSVSEKHLELRSLNVLAEPIFQWSEKISSLPIEQDPTGNLSSVVSEFRLLHEDSKQEEGHGESAPSGDSSSQFLALEGGYLDLEKKSFLISPVQKLVSQFRRFQYGVFADEGLTEYKHETAFDPRRPSVRFSAQMAPQLQLTFKAWGATARFELIQKLEKFSISGIAGAKRLPMRASAQPQIHLGRDGQFSIVRFLNPDEGLPLSNPMLHGLSSRGLEILSTLAQGMAGFYGVESKALASKKKHSRDFELRLTRHQGVANLILHEALHVNLRGTTTDEKKINSGAELIQALEPKIIALTLPTSMTTRNGANGDSYPPPVRLQDLCATTVIKKLKDFASHFLAPDNDIFSTILPEGEIAVGEMYRQEAELFLAILDFAAVVSKGEIFGRARMNLFEKMMVKKEASLRDIQILISPKAPDLTSGVAGEFNVFQLPFNELGARAQASNSDQLKTAISALRGLSKSGFTFFFAGRKLSELTNDDLRAELTLSEKLNEPAGSGATQLHSYALNWFELNPKFFLHGKEMNEADAKKLLLEGMMEHEGQFYLVPTNRLPSLQKLGQFWLRLQQNKGKPSKGFSRPENVLQVPPSEVLEMLALRASGISVIGNKRWLEIARFYDELERHDRDFTLPSSIHADLKAYQKIGVQRLYELYRIGLGSVLADDMGLGKTLQALSFLEKLRSEDQMGRVLIVVPTSLTYNWLSERDKFTPELPVMSFSGKLKEKSLDFLNQANAVLLTTYGLMQEHREFFQNINWNVVIFDEAQNLKNIAAQRTTVARSLQSTIKLCLTGTPLENHFGEFYSLLDLAVPGCLGSLESFRETFVNPTSIELSDVQYLKLKSKPLLLRRTKKEILSELPDKQESQVVLEFEAKQKVIYRDIAISYNEKIQQTIATEGEAKCQLQMLTALLRLRQACSDPGALPNIKYTKTPPKREMLRESIVEIIDSGESALVFTQFLHTLKNVEADLKTLKLPTFVIHGGLSKSQRERALTDFNASEGGAILLMTLKTGGVGLNLTKASYVFHLEPWWNPAVENQATDRAHRMGQKRSVQVYRYIMRESVEEKIEHLKAQKQKRFDAIFSEVEDLDQTDTQVAMKKGSHLTKEDFSFLLSSGNQS